MVRAVIERTAAEVKKSLREDDGLTVTYVQLGSVLGMSVTGETPITGTNLSLKRKIVSATTVAAEPAPIATKASKPKRARGRSPVKGLSTSNQPPRVKRTEGGAKAAAALLEFLEQFPMPETYPINLTKFRRGGALWVRGTTIDSETIELSAADAIQNLSRRDEMAYAIPLFGPRTESKIVTLVAKLDGTPTVDAKDENGFKLYAGRKAWYFNLLQIGIRIWGGYENPPSLDLEQFPHRTFREDGTTRMGTTTFRYRSVVIGFVTRLKLAFEDESLNSVLTGSEHRRFDADWLDEFIARKRIVSIGDGQKKSFLDFKINGKQGSPEQLKTVWELVETNQKAAGRAAAKSKSPGRRARKGQ